MATKSKFSFYYSSLWLYILPLIATAQEFNPMEICQGKPDEATVVNPLSCDSFLLCKNNLPDGIGKCPSDMLFNAIAEICDFPGNVNCGTVPMPPYFEQTITPDITTTAAIDVTTTLAQLNSSCPVVEDPVFPTYLSIPDDCSSYIMCYHSNPLIMKCPTGMVWNKAQLKCDKPENSNCQATFKDKYGCPEKGIDFLPHPEKCEKFIFCMDGVSRVQVCQMFKYFDPVLAECVLGVCQ